MTKGEGLIWELFEMVRELMPATAANTERFQRWSERFHEMEHGVDPSSSATAADEPDRAEPVHTADHDDDDDDIAEDPHEHGVPARPKIGRKKK